MTEQHDRGTTSDAAGINDNVIAEVKGPDPSVWGEEHAAADPNDVGDPNVPSGLAYGEIINEGTDEELKGPDESIWRPIHEAIEGE